MTNFEKVGIFMKTFGQEVKTKAELINNIKMLETRGFNGLITFVKMNTSLLLWIWIE